MVSKGIRGGGGVKSEVMRVYEIELFIYTLAKMEMTYLEIR
jgi:hypothetical protein